MEIAKLKSILSRCQLEKLLRVNKQGLGGEDRITLSVFHHVIQCMLIL